MTDELIGLATALVGLLTVVIVQVRKVHKMVNSRLDEALDRIEQLTAALLQSDTAVPERPGRHES